MSNKDKNDDSGDDLEDEFAAFEREAKEAAAKAQSQMSEPKKEAPKKAEAAPASSSSDDDDDEDEEDEFAAFEREAKEAAAAATAAMAQSNSASSSDDQAASAEKNKAEETVTAEADSEEAATAGGGSAADDAAKEAALAASKALATEKSEGLFGKDGKVATQTILVVGGGIAGVTAATEAAETGYDVILLEKSPALGGRVTRLNRYFPKLCNPNCGLEINYQRIKANPRIKVMTMCEVDTVAGSVGNFTVSVKQQPTYVEGLCDGCGQCAEGVEAEVPNAYNYNMDKTKAVHLAHEHAFPMRYVIDPSVIGTDEQEKIAAKCDKGLINFDQKEESFDLNVGAIIWATGWKPYDSKNLETYNYHNSADIINNVEMERLANHDGPTKGKILRQSNGEAVNKVALIQCAGSRDHNHLAYCSMICCLASLKHAAYVREQHPDAEVDIYYIDIRAHDKMSQFYERIRKDDKVNFIKSKPAHILIDEEDGSPVVCGENTFAHSDMYKNKYDLVVLATGMQASLAADFKPEGMEKDDYGFVIDSEGQFAAGGAAGPLDVALSTQSATAAALKAILAVRANSGS